MKKLFKAIMIIILLFGVYIIYQAVRFNFVWKIEIIGAYANVRLDHDIHSDNIYKVNRGGEFEVIEIYLEDNNYIWYKVKINNSKIGWIASSRTEPTVKEINNPKQEELGVETLDYNPPVIRYYHESVEFLNIDSINYKHLDATDESDFEITHEVYVETDSKEVDYTQYFIEYIAIDEYDNETRVVQEIKFIEEPTVDQVKDIKELKER